MWKGLEKVSIKIIDNKGTLVYESSFKESTDGIEVSVLDLKEGLYFCFIESEKGSVWKRMLIRKGN